MSKRNNGWSEYEKLVLSKLDGHDKLIADILKQLQSATEHLSDFKLEALKTIEAHRLSCTIVAEFPKVARDIEGIKTSLLNIRKAEKEISDSAKEIVDLKVSVGQLNVKSGLWGALGGIVGLAMLMIGMWVKNDFSQILYNVFK